MPLIVTPRQLSQRSELYRQLGQLNSAGIGIIQALEIVAKNSSSDSVRVPLREVAKRLSQGQTIAEAWHHIGIWVPEFDIALVRAAEKSGHLDSVFKMLADHYQDNARLLKQVRADMAYPVFVFHFAIFLFAFTSFIKSGSILTPVLIIFGILPPIYCVVLFAIHASQSNHGVQWREKMEKILRPIPLLGSGRHSLALARLSAALLALLNAGVNIVEAWEMAAAACGSPALHNTVLGWKRLVMSGTTPSECVNRNSAQFPEFFANIYNAGEVSGKLDDSLKRINAFYRDDGSSKLHLFCQWVPKLFFILLALGVGFYVIHSWMGYFSMVNDAMK